MEILAFAALALHIVVIFAIVLWFALGKPISRAEFWRRFCHELLGIRPRTTPRS